MEYKSGQIVKTIAYQYVGTPVMYHFGVILVDDQTGEVFVLHNSLDKGTIQETLEVFLQEREIAEVLPSSLENLTNEQIIQRFENCDGDFDYLAFNCEHFIDCMEGTTPKSEQLVVYALIGIAILIILKT